MPPTVAGQSLTPLPPAKLLDTDVLSKMAKARVPDRLQRIVGPEPRLLTTAINLAEVYYGLAKAGSPRLRLLYEERVFPYLTVLPFEEEAAVEFGRLRAALEAGGNRLDDADLMIASVAISRGLVLVTANVRHFSRIPGLRIENWLD